METGHKYSFTCQHCGQKLTAGDSDECANKIREHAKMHDLDVSEEEAREMVETEE
jgi:transcription initiation factor IIE alpha subunit